MGGVLIKSPRPPTALWRERLAALFENPSPAMTLTLAAVVTGFFHGWLKLRFPSPATTFLFDGWLILAILAVWWNKPPGEPFFIPTGVAKAYLWFALGCLLYLFLPGGPPLLIGLAALRGWCFPPLLYFLGFHATRSEAQVKGLFYVLILLGVLTGVHGLRQDPAQIQQRSATDPVFAERYKYTYYATAGGKLEFRRFSTFVSSGVFGSVMAFVAIFAVALLTEARTGWPERAALAAAVVLLLCAQILSGARSALLILSAGLAVIAWHRRRWTVYFLAPALLYAGFRFASAHSEGAAAERFGTLLETGTILERFLIPTQIGWRSMAEAPLGHGLGKSGYSVPFFLAGKTGYQNFRTVDGDLGALMIEMGAVGLILFGLLLWRALRFVFGCLGRSRGADPSSVALAAAACLVTAIMTFPIGSPFLGIPSGALTWFFLGCLQKLDFKAEPPQPGAPPPWAGKKFLHSHSGG